jgi:hypothetical protein
MGGWGGDIVWLAKIQKYIIGFTKLYEYCFNIVFAFFENISKNRKKKFGMKFQAKIFAWTAIHFEIYISSANLTFTEL